jgi:hypothetical protein
MDFRKKRLEKGLLNKIFSFLNLKNQFSLLISVIAESSEACVE